MECRFGKRTGKQIMTLTMLEIFDFIGTLAFAISGAIVAIRKKMDVFGVIMLAIATACGGGMIRDLIAGNTPPNVFIDPRYALTAAAVGAAVFVFMYFHRSIPAGAAPVYEKFLFWFDTLGLAAFTADGVMVGVHTGYGGNAFLLVFLGFMTGVGGGALRDILADQMPDIFRKHIYALASIAGGISITFSHSLGLTWQTSMIVGFVTVILLRFLAQHFAWNLPKVNID